MAPKREFVIIGMSGGVDSSVAARLLLEQGYKVEGLFMKNWEESDDVAYCTAQQDLEDAAQVCQELEIPLHSVNFAKQYWDRVFSDFLREYRAGRTPNPDIICNKEIKFSAFLNYALKLGADKIATGHYARIQENNGSYNLQKGTDCNKDQSYFLHQLSQQELKHSLFPLGSIEKSSVRAIATECGFDNHEKKDSTGICFIGERKFRDFLSKYLPATHGDIKTLDGEIIGKHQGAAYYTIGQRQGLGIGGVKNAGETPWYVVEKNIKNNVLTVVQGDNHPALYNTHLSSKHIHWINTPPTKWPYKCKAKIRYRQEDQDCTISLDSQQHSVIQFNKSQRAVSPGQSVVFYQNDICLGGGIIEHAFNLDA